jgi:uncharacterized FlgJ-related protein
MLPKMYKFDTNRLVHVKISRGKIISTFVMLILISLTVGYVAGLIRGKIKRTPSYEELVILVNDKENELASPKAIYEFMKEIGIKYPEIVWSQTVLETGFKSKVCKENHNFFGMKLAACRPNVQTGENLNHATYLNWKMSVIDYAIWQSSTGVWKLKSEAEYYNYLDGRYAEDPDYIYKVQNIRKNFDSYLEEYETRYNNGTLR